MRTVAENLEILYNSVQNIKQAITEKGGDVSGDITTWGNVISSIGSSDGPGSVFKITNKLNGQLIGGPSYFISGNEVFHSYNFTGGTFNHMAIFPVNVEDAHIYTDNTVNYTYDMEISVECSNFKYGQYSFMCNFKTPSLIWAGYGGQCYATEKSNLWGVIAFDTNNNYDIDFVRLQNMGPCLLKDTKITLSDNTCKLIQDITYNDELLVWNFDEGKYESAKPLWIKKKQFNAYYFKCVLEDGTVLNLTGPKSHRLFSVEDNMFIYGIDMVGKTTYTENGLVKVVSCEKCEEECEYYNIITDYHMNLFANGVLTSCRYNNLYPIQDMKFVKDDRLNRAPKWKLYEQFRDHRELDRYIDGLRLYEQLDIPLEDTIKYCTRLNDLRKNLDEFEGNESIKNTIEDTEVGWIDRDGKSYGYKVYMPGQNNHINLADKICKELNVETENPSRYLEKEGWLKYTTEFVLNSDDKEINDNQLNTLRKFLKTPNKLKKEGKIKIGDIMSDYVNILEFDTMDKYSFEYRKKHGRK